MHHTPNYVDRDTRFDSRESRIGDHDTILHLLKIVRPMSAYIVCIQRKYVVHAPDMGVVKIWREKESQNPGKLIYVIYFCYIDRMDDYGY